MESTTIVDRLHAHALNKPSHIAFRFLDDHARIDRSVTWYKLWEQASFVAQNLRARGMSGRRIITLLPTGPEFVASLFGILLADSVAVPLKPSRSSELASRLTGMLCDVDASAVLVDELIAERCSANLVSQNCISIRELLTAPDSLPLPRGGGIDIAIIQYTSGSTSAPKGVEVTHNNILSNAQAICRATDVDENSVGVSWLPLFHDMGLMGSLLTTAYVGCELNLFNPASFIRRPLSWLAAIKMFSATHAPAPNFAFDYCCEKITDEDVKNLDFSSLRMFMSGAETVRPSTMLRFIEKFGPAGMTPTKICASYGLAEATLFVTGSGSSGLEIVKIDHDCLSTSGRIRTFDGQGRGRAIASVGLPQQGTTVRIVDPVTGCLMPDDQVGEIWVHGPTVANGYFRQPTATEDVFRNRIPGADEAMFLKTGDLGFLREKHLFITGRLNDLIVVRGVNHHPEDIEASAKEAYPGLSTHASAAFATESEIGELIIVQEIPRKLSSNSPALFHALSDAIGKGHGITPVEIIFVRSGSLPTTSSGKIRRSAVRDCYLAGSLAIVDRMSPLVLQNRAPRRPMTPKEESIYRIWSEVLESDNIGPDDNFFSVGGNSIDLIRIHSLLAIDNADLEIEKLFECPTIATLAAHLEGEKNHDRVATARARGGQRRAALRSRSYVN